MAGLDDLSRGQLDGILKRLRALETAAPLQNASIGANGLRVYGGGGINIENGGLVVNGSAQIVGTLNADGTINMRGVFIATGDVKLNGPTDVTGNFTVTGPTKLDGKTDVAGDFTVTGPTKLNGKTDIGGNTAVDGTLDIKGKSTLQNDLTVQGGGKVKVGGMTLDPAASGGSVVFSGGGGVQGTSGVVALRGSGNAGFLTDQSASMFAGTTQVDVASGSVTISGLPSTSSGKANVHMDSSGRLYRVTNP